MSDGTDDGGEQQDAPGRDESTPEFETGTFNDWIGLQVEDLGEGTARLSVDCESFKQNPGGVMHGGVTATLIDVAGGMAIGSSVEDRQPMATTNLDVTYIRPITNTATATAEVVRVGSSNGVASVEVESTNPEGERTTVAIGTVTYTRM